MQCHVINLADSPERLAHMRAALGGIGIDFQRFDAIDIPRSRQHPALGLIPPMRIRPWTPSELACLLSHYEVWKLVAAGAGSYAAVFEDDLHVDPRLAQLIKDRSALPPDADLVKLETVRRPVWLTRREVPGPAGTRYAEMKSLHHGSGAYILSRDTAALLVRSIGVFDLPPDDVMWGVAHPLCRKLRRYQVLPALVTQDIILPSEQWTPALASTSNRRAHGPPRHWSRRRGSAEVCSWGGCSSSGAWRAICATGCCGAKSSCRLRPAASQWRARSEDRPAQCWCATPAAILAVGAARRPRGRGVRVR